MNVLCVEGGLIKMVINISKESLRKVMFNLLKKRYILSRLEFGIDEMNLEEVEFDEAVDILYKEMEVY